MKIEAIPNIAAPVYALIARKSVFMRDVRGSIVDDICAAVSSGTMLDVGTGPGYFPVEIAKRKPDLEITGIDLSDGMVNIASRNALKAGLAGRVMFQTANAAHLPFPDGSFDIVISTLSSHHWKDLAAYLNEISRVLKPGGRCMIYDFRKDISPETAADVRKKYGRFLSFFFLGIARMHCSMSVVDAERVIQETRFSQRNASGMGVVLKLDLGK